MTACAHGDRGLAALALYEAVTEGNTANWRAVVDTTEPAALVTGLVTLVHSLIVSLAAQTGTSRDGVVDVLRWLLLTEDTP